MDLVIINKFYFFFQILSTLYTNYRILYGKKFDKTKKKYK